MMISGVRQEVDPDLMFAPYLADSMELANAEAEKMGKRFFFDEMDVAMRAIGGKNCMDMFGWLVDESDVEDFELAWMDGHDDRLDRFDHGIVEFKEGAGGKPEVIFDF